MFIQVEGLREIILLGYYQSNDHLSGFIDQMKREFGVSIRYFITYLSPFTNFLFGLILLSFSVISFERHK